MRTKVRLRALAIALFLCVLIAGTPLMAEPGGPTLDYLTNTIKPLLDSMAARIGSLLASVGSVSSTLNTINSRQAAQPTLRVVRTKFTTLPHTITPFNLDVSSGAQGAFGNVRRYTVTFDGMNLSSAPAGIDTVNLFVGVYDGVSAIDATVASYDPAGRPSLITGPYAGTNSFFSIRRGNDGLGAVDVRVNAYIESEP